LGFFSSLISSLFVASVIASTGWGWAVFTILLILGGLCVFLAFWRNESLMSRVTLLGVGLIDFTGAIVTATLKGEWHETAGYLNRVMIYMLIALGLICSLACFWNLVTALISTGWLDAAGIDRGQETLIYVMWAALIAFISAWFYALYEEGSRSAMMKHAITYTIGWWFFGAILAGGLGILIISRGTGGAGAATTASPGLSTAAAVSEYDKIG
jgi:hypothetical protein